VFGDFLDRFAIENRRAVDQDVDAAERFEHFTDHPLDLGDAFEIRAERMRAATRAPDSGDDRFRFGARAVVVDRDRGSASGQMLRDRPADAARRAGHQCGLAFEFHQGMPVSGFADAFGPKARGFIVASTAAAV